MREAHFKPSMCEVMSLQHIWSHSYTAKLNVGVINWTGEKKQQNWEKFRLGVSTCCDSVCTLLCSGLGYSDKNISVRVQNTSWFGWCIMIMDGDVSTSVFGNVSRCPYRCPVVWLDLQSAVWQPCWLCWLMETLVEICGLKVYDQHQTV